MKTRLFVLLSGMLFLAIGCAPTVYFGVPSKTLTVPDEFGQTEAIVQKAEKSSGAQYCPDKVARARVLGKKGIETYWACRTGEALRLLAESRKLAEGAMLCKAPPPKPVDSDGDGVYDDKDQCPNTPKGVKVDSKGCPLDTDGDGVYDYLDKCPGTPQGVKVDRTGCPLDTDGDGVYDYMDKCPGTPKGAKVDARGCWVLKGVYFDTAKWNIKPQSYPVLDEALEVLKRNPGLKVEVQGHTDSRGSAKYNQKLSAKRAKAVMDYFVKKGISSSQLMATGYGYTMPAATNTTEEGRAANRRVELRPLR